MIPKQSAREMEEKENQETHRGTRVDDFLSDLGLGANAEDLVFALAQSFNELIFAERAFFRVHHVVLILEQLDA